VSVVGAARIDFCSVSAPGAAHRRFRAAGRRARRAGTNRDHARLAADIGWAVRRSARCYVPFKEMAARVMLKRRGVASVIGATK
jgi:hypothetical protein